MFVLKSTMGWFWHIHKSCATILTNFRVFFIWMLWCAFDPSTQEIKTWGFGMGN